MVPKIKAALAAVGWPGAEAVICDSKDPHALTRALSDPEFGTRITAGRDVAGSSPAPAPAAPAPAAPAV